MRRSIITGTGCYIPPLVQPNNAFEKQSFYSSDQQLLEVPSPIIVQKFKDVTGIEERRYTTDDLKASDIGALAAEMAITDSGINPEEIDQLIVAHNFGNISSHTIQNMGVPSLAAQVKHKLGIKNPNCIAYDILFGCPGWLQGLIQADAFFKAGVANKALIIGTETLSRVIDKYDRDSMIFSDGAGAAVLEYKDSNETGPGILGSSAETHALQEVDYINMARSYHPNSSPEVVYIKMQGRKVYEFAMKHVPAAMKNCLDKCGVGIDQVKKIFIHQANAKMDDAILKRLYKLYNAEAPQQIMPMSIHWLGNSSVATIPTLYDQVKKGKSEGHALSAGDIVLFASVGAGMNINAVCYRC